MTDSNSDGGAAPTLDEWKEAFQQKADERAARVRARVNRQLIGTRRRHKATPVNDDDNAVDDMRMRYSSPLVSAPQSFPPDVQACIDAADHWPPTFAADYDEDMQYTLFAFRIADANNWRDKDRDRLHTNDTHRAGYQAKVMGIDRRPLPKRYRFSLYENRVPGSVSGIKD